MDGVGTPIIGRPRPLPSHDTPNPAHNTYPLKCEEPLWVSRFRMCPYLCSTLYVWTAYYCNFDHVGGVVFTLVFAYLLVASCLATHDRMKKRVGAWARQWRCSRAQVGQR